MCQVLAATSPSLSAPLNSRGSDGLGWKAGWILSNGSGDEVGTGTRRSDPFVEVDSEEGGKKFLCPHQ